MSLILEALKKSESQRRLGEAPTLGTPFSARRRRRSPLPWLLLAIVIVGVGGWWWLRPGSAPTDAAVATNSAVKPGGAFSNVAAGAAQDGANSRRSGPVSPSRPGTRTVPAAPGTLSTVTAIAAAPAVSPASPPKAPPFVSPSAPPAQTAPVAAARTPVPVPVGTPAASSPTMTPPPPTAGMPTSTPATAAATNPAPAAISPPAATPATEGPAVQSISDLPYSMRRDLPDIPISMQVYSADATRRFVVVDGTRKIEGDVIKDTVALREIRPNGVVLEFHGQRFFVPRPGS
jgi:general secretion pathway protein B